MIKPWTVLQELEADNSRLKKEAIIQRESDADNKDFFDGCVWRWTDLEHLAYRRCPHLPRMVQD